MTATRPTWGEVFEVPPSTTAEDLLRMPDDGYKYELYGGVLVREMTFAGHGALCQRLGGELYLYVRTTGYPNRVVQNTLFDLTPPGLTPPGLTPPGLTPPGLTPPGAPACMVLAPDLAIMRSTTPVVWDSVPREAPLLAVEVLSPSQTGAEIGVKVQTYRNAGVEEVWLVDHKLRTVEVWSTQGHATLGESQDLTSPLLPGFSVAVRFLLDG